MKATKLFFIMAVVACMALAGCENKVEPAPSITDFSPTEAKYGATLTITGKRFSAVPSENSVTFNDVPAAIISATSKEIKVTVPKNLLCSGPIRVTVGSKTAVSSGVFNYLPTAVVSALAGSGTAGFADGTGTAARFNQPYGVAVDASGNVYVGDYYNHRIRKITPVGVVTTLAGSTQGFANGTGTAARFNYPEGVAIDVSGNVYVADCENNRIRKITPAGAVTTLAGSGAWGFADGTGTAAQFNYPEGVAIDVSGNVYVGDFGNHRIRKITPAGVVTTLAGDGTAGYKDATGAAAQFTYPSGVAVDASGNVYVGDFGNHRIRKITPAGVVTTLAGDGAAGFKNATGTAARFDNPCGVAVVSGNVYVTDWSNYRIRKIDSTTKVTTFAGSGAAGFADGTGTAAQFDRPAGIAINASGDVLYVADRDNHRIRKIAME